MSEATYLIGDVFDVLATIPDGSVDLILTSPPFLALRSYLPADHPDKHKEIGSEPTPAEFLDTLLALTAEWGRVLAPHGSIAVELGDTYSGTGGVPADAGKRYNNHNADISSYGSATVTRVRGDIKPGGSGWPLDKSLCGIPHLYHLSLAYGRNLLTGEPSPAGQWRVRNVVAWCRPNPPVGALGDKFRPATSYMTVATRARDRWFDLDAVRTEPKAAPQRFLTPRGYSRGGDGNEGGGRKLHVEPANECHPAGAPPLDWWQVSTEPYSGSHYATWPRKLLDRPIKAMCPIHVCTTCGEPRRRIVGDVTYSSEHAAVADGQVSWSGGGGRSVAGLTTGTNSGLTRQADTIGWSDCGHDTWRNGIVLDPFAGSGTTLAVATGHGRDAIGIDLDERNAHLAQERIGMFLTVTDTRKATA